MDFNKYQHVERLGTKNVEGIEQGRVWVFPKIDGSNGCVWLGDDGTVHVGGRNRELSADDSNQGFYQAVTGDQRIAAYLAKHPTHIIYGEWLIPHTLKSYVDTAWRKFYIFDVKDNDEYLPYETYKPLLEEFGLEYIPLIESFEDPGMEDFVSCLEKNTYLTSYGVGEGVVIKNYGYHNPYGRQTWAKIIASEFAEKRGTQKNNPLSTEQRIVDDFVTAAFINKEFAKLTEEVEWSPRLAPRLFSTVFHVLIEEEMYNIVKRYKQPTINFRTLNYLITEKIKEVLADHFGKK